MPSTSHLSTSSIYTLVIILIKLNRYTVNFIPHCHAIEHCFSGAEMLTRFFRCWILIFFSSYLSFTTLYIQNFLPKLLSLCCAMHAQPTIPSFLYANNIGYHNLYKRKFAIYSSLTLSILEYTARHCGTPLQHLHPTPSKTSNILPWD